MFELASLSTRSLPLLLGTPAQSKPEASPHPTKIPSRFESAFPEVTKLLLPLLIQTPKVPSWLALQSVRRLPEASWLNSIPAKSFESASRLEKVPLLLALRMPTCHPETFAKNCAAHHGIVD